MIIYHYTTPTETLQAFNGRVWATPVANAEGDELQQLPWGEADALATAVAQATVRV